MIPILTQVVVAIPFLFTGSLLLESFFGIPGLGSITVDAIQGNDFSTLRTIVFVGSLLFVVAQVLTDVSYSLADPRVQAGIGGREVAMETGCSPTWSWRCSRPLRRGSALFAAAQAAALASGRRGRCGRRRPLAILVVSFYLGGRGPRLHRVGRRRGYRERTWSGRTRPRR